MFVPVHRRHSRNLGTPSPRRVRASAVFAAVFGSLAAALVGTLMNGVHADTGGYTVLGVVIAIVAVGVGVALAKAVGRQGKV